MDTVQQDTVQWNRQTIRKRVQTLKPVDGVSSSGNCEFKEFKNYTKWLTVVERLANGGLQFEGCGFQTASLKLQQDGYK